MFLNKKVHLCNVDKIYNSYFCIAVTKIPKRKTLREELLILAHGFRGFSPSWWGGCGGGLMVTCKQRKRDTGANPAFSFPFYSAQAPAQGMVPRTFRVCLPLSVNSFWKNHHTDIPEV
jgi:hypothetical protein